MVPREIPGNANGVPLLQSEFAEPAANLRHVPHLQAPRVHFDGHTRFDLREGDRVTVRRYSHAISLLHPARHSYYTMLREKLNWNR